MEPQTSRALQQALRAVEATAELVESTLKNVTEPPAVNALMDVRTFLGAADHVLRSPLVKDFLDRHPPTS
jgi:hypothetical protein